MKMITRPSLCIALLCIGFSSAAFAASDYPSLGSKVAFCGKVVALEDGRCLAVKDQTGKSYVVNAAEPKVSENMHIEGEGRAAVGTRCGATAVLSDVIYKEVKTCKAHRP